MRVDLTARAARGGLRALDWELILIGLLTLSLFIFMSYWSVQRLNLFSGDGVARTYSAKSIFFAREPKAANVGFVWAPLPTLLQLPLFIIPFLRQGSLAGNILTSIMGMGNVLLLVLLLREVNLPRWLGWIFTAVYVFNPYATLYSVNGLSENTLLFFTFSAIYLFLRWIRTNQWVYLTGVGLMSAVASMARYDGLIVAAFLIGAAAIKAFLDKPDQPAYAESSIWISATPVVYIFTLWIFLNFQIMGDPLFFSRSETSLAMRLSGLLAGREWMVPLKFNVITTLQASFLEIGKLYPAFLILSFVIIVFAILRKKQIWLLMLMACWGLAAFTIGNIFLGNSQFSLRYFMSVIPMAFVLAAGVVDIFKEYKVWVSIPLLTLLILSNFSSFKAMQWDDPFDNDNRYVEAWLTQQPAEIFTNEKKMANFIDTQTQGLVLVDDFLGNQVIIFSNHPERFVVSSDSLFKRYLIEPAGHVDYFLVAKPRIYLDQVNRVYPTLFDDGAPWTTLEADFGLWRLYKVNQAPTTILNQDPFLYLEPK